MTLLDFEKEKNASLALAILYGPDPKTVQVNARAAIYFHEFWPGNV